jgi:hypothetical protein
LREDGVEVKFALKVLETVLIFLKAIDSFTGLRPVLLKSKKLKSFLLSRGRSSR